MSNKKGLGSWDFLTIIGIWAALAAISYFTSHISNGIAFCCLFPGYYLSKWIIKRGTDN